MKIKALIIAGILIASFVLVAGCNGTSDAGVGFSGTPRECQAAMTDHGNGVLFFPCNGAAYENTLSAYIAQNNVTVTSQAGVPSIGTIEYIDGYIVTVVPRGEK